MLNKSICINCFVESHFISHFRSPSNKISILFKGLINMQMNISHFTTHGELIKLLRHTVVKSFSCCYIYFVSELIYPKIAQIRTTRQTVCTTTKPDCNLLQILMRFLFPGLCLALTKAKSRRATWRVNLPYL